MQYWGKKVLQRPTEPEREIQNRESEQNAKQWRKHSVCAASTFGRNYWLLLGRQIHGMGRALPGLLCVPLAQACCCFAGLAGEPCHCLSPTYSCSLLMVTAAYCTRSLVKGTRSNETEFKTGTPEWGLISGQLPRPHKISLQMCAHYQCRAPQHQMMGFASCFGFGHKELQRDKDLTWYRGL